MEPLVPTLTFEQLRRAKKNASRSLESLGVDLSSSTTGNFVANVFGYQNWNTAKASTEKEDFGVQTEKSLEARMREEQEGLYGLLVSNRNHINDAIEHIEDVLASKKICLDEEAYHCLTRAFNDMYYLSEKITEYIKLRVDEFKQFDPNGIAYVLENKKSFEINELDRIAHISKMIVSDDLLTILRATANEKGLL